LTRARSLKQFEILISFVFLSLFLISCSTKSVAPVDNRKTAELYHAAPVTSYDPEPVTKGFHEVIDGDTLYSISWRYGIDYRDVAAWNKISSNFVIYPGQRLWLIPGRAPASKTITSTPVISGTSKPPSISSSKPKSSASPIQQRPRPVINQQAIQWRWPTIGRIIKSNTPIAQKGLDISGNEGQEIQAAADGVVVYSGSGLLGYGNLIIVKHNETYLSAYAHNKVMRVKEGDMIKAGQGIGNMGKSSRGQVLLHFEIRKDGKTVDPLQYLPSQS
jgi:lipoprotein NlpD